MVAKLQPGSVWRPWRKLATVATGVGGLDASLLCKANVRFQYQDESLQCRREAGIGPFPLPELCDLECIKLPLGRAALWGTYMAVGRKCDTRQMMLGRKGHIRTAMSDTRQCVGDGAPHCSERACGSCLPGALCSRDFLGEWTPSSKTRIAGEAAAEIHAPAKSLRMHNGAAHDAQILATVMPAGMLFVPSISDVSHHWTENTSDEEITLGATVLFVEARQRMLCAAR